MKCVAFNARLLVVGFAGGSPEKVDYCRSSHGRADHGVGTIELVTAKAGIVDRCILGRDNE